VIRTAVITDPSRTNLRTVQAYLPRLYSAVELDDGTIVVVGKDNAGWTWEGYVKPRLLSGLIGTTEV